MKIVINTCYGGFGLSKKAKEELKKIGYSEAKIFTFDYLENRTDKDLVEVVEKLKEEANGESAYLEVIEIPDEATDYELSSGEYGDEEVIYVVNGKIHHAY